MADARRFLESLVGRPLRTVTGRENRVLRVDRDSVLIWTSRSPSGQPVPIAWVQDALDRIEHDGEIEISVESVGYRSAFIGAVVRELPGAEVVRTTSPPRIRLSRAAGRPDVTADRRVVLLGCVKLKVDHSAAAKDLYRSPLWAARRAYAEASGHPWLILSAMHGLVEARLDPYDLALGDLSAPDRRAWGERVIAALEQRFGDLHSMVFEVHAGEAYRRGIEPGVVRLGGHVKAPLQGLPLGSQLAWYASRSRAPELTVERRRASTAAEFRAAVEALDAAPFRIAVYDWPSGLTGLDQPGLYSWWVDAAGAADLSDGLGHQLHAGRIYAGQTGATKWPLGTAGAATLATRIGGNHLHGRIRGSTFRLTLASCLLGPLALVRVGRRQLDPPSEARLSAWMCEHLQVAVLPFHDRDQLADLEHRVLSELDPPLNLDGMAPTPLRSKLSRLRATLASPREERGV